MLTMAFCSKRPKRKAIDSNYTNNTDENLTITVNNTGKNAFGWTKQTTTTTTNMKHENFIDCNNIDDKYEHLATTVVRRVRAIRVDKTTEQLQ